MRVLLELIRILFIIMLLGGILGSILLNIYEGFHTEQYGLLGGLGILTLLFILYRNKLQFSGWYQGPGREKLSKPVTRILISISIVLLVAPFVLGSFYN